MCSWQQPAFQLHPLASGGRSSSGLTGRLQATTDSTLGKKELIVLSYLDLAGTMIGLFKSEALDNTAHLIDGNNWLLLSVYYTHLECPSPSSLQILQEMCFRMPNLSKTLKKAFRASLVITMLSHVCSPTYTDVWGLLQTLPLDSCWVLIFVRSWGFKLVPLHVI